MGMFDSVYAKCSCGSELEWQSKAGECMLRVYSSNAVPSNIAADINDEIEECIKCGKRYKITGCPMPPFINMNVEQV